MAYTFIIPEDGWILGKKFYILLNDLESDFHFSTDRAILSLLWTIQNILPNRNDDGGHYHPMG